MKKPKFDLNKELEQIEDITYTEDDKGKYPELTEKNIRLVDKYVNEKSSYAPSKNDDFVKKYFQEKKGDISMASVITKIILIDTVDSTNLKHNLGINYYIDFAERIINSDLETKIARGDSIGDTFKKVASFPKKEVMKKEDINFFIFLSKYITRTNQYSYRGDAYSIMDGVVKDCLPLYTSGDCKGYKKERKELELMRNTYKYDDYCKYIHDNILNKLQGITRNELDHFIWFSFKKPAARDK